MTRTEMYTKQLNARKIRENPERLNVRVRARENVIKVLKKEVSI